MEIIKPDAYLYDEQQIKIVEDHIVKHFGEVKTVLHEFASFDIHVDVEIVEPTEDKNYYTLITVGMGTYKMNVPEDYKDERIDRIELLLCLPPDWDLKTQNDEYRWPGDLLRDLARLPLRENSWLGYGHTIPNGVPFADNTKLSSTILLGLQDASNEACTCELPDGDRILFYQIIPLYDEETEYKLANGTNALLSHMGDVDHVIDINRKSVI